MEILDKELKPPVDVVKTTEKEAERVQLFLRNRNIPWVESRIKSIAKDISKKYETWKRQTAPLQKRLVRWNDLMEGVVGETNFPFIGASNITLHYVAGMARTFKSTFNKAMYQDTDLAIPVVDPDSNIPEQQLKDLADGFNYLISKKFNVIDTLKQGTIPCVRDGTLVATASWERRVETSHDSRIYTTPSEFIKDYPRADDAGVSEEEYKTILNHFIDDPDNQIRISFDTEFVEFDGIEAKINSLAHFINYPVFSPDIRRSEMYGNKYNSSMSEINNKVRKNEFYAHSLEEIVRLKNDFRADSWERAVMFSQGITQADGESKPVELLDLVYKCDLNGDGIPEKYFVTFAPESKTVLSLQKYAIRNNIDVSVAFGLVRRENRFYRNSLIGDCEDLFNQIDTLIRHENNVMMLTTSPVFIANQSYKDALDFGAPQNVIRPGLTLWVQDITKAISQLPIQNLEPPSNTPEMMSIYTRFVELVWGPTQGLSGKQTTDDPRSPARKTQMLLVQANQRVDDMMDEFRSSLPDLFNLCAALIYQYYGKSKVSLNINNKNIKFPINLLSDPRIKWEAKRRSVNLTPEFAMARMEALISTYVNLRPLIMQGDPIAIETWNRQVINSGEPDTSKFMIDPQKANDIAQFFRQMQQQMIERGINLKAELKGKQNLLGELGKELGKKISGTSQTLGLDNLSGMAVPGGQVPGQLSPNGNQLVSPGIATGNTGMGI